jgi:hypothetical protein
MNTNPSKEEVMAIETTEKYCPICGKQVVEPASNRFGEWACSEAHADEYVKEVRAQKMRAAAPAQEEQPQRHPRQMCGG